MSSLDQCVVGRRVVTSSLDHRLAGPVVGWTSEPVDRGHAQPEDVAGEALDAAGRPGEQRREPLGCEADSGRCVRGDEGGRVPIDVGLAATEQPGHERAHLEPVQSQRTVRCRGREQHAWRDGAVDHPLRVENRDSVGEVSEGPERRASVGAEAGERRVFALERVPGVLDHEEAEAELSYVRGAK